MTKPFNASCEMCAYAVMKQLDHRGTLTICHRFPPILDTREGVTQGSNLFPTTAPGDWCGEFQEEK